MWQDGDRWQGESYWTRRAPAERRLQYTVNIHGRDRQQVVQLACRLLKVLKAKIEGPRKPPVAWIAGAYLHQGTLYLLHYSTQDVGHNYLRGRYWDGSDWVQIEEDYPVGEGWTEIALPFPAWQWGEAVWAMRDPAWFTDRVYVD